VEEIDAIVTSLAVGHNVEIKNKMIFKYSLFGLYRYQDNSFGFAMEEGTDYNGETIEKIYYSFIIMDSEQYNAITNSNLQLEEKQASILHLQKSSIGNKDAVIVLKDEEAIKELENELLAQVGVEAVSYGLYRHNYKVNFEGSEEDKKELAAEVQNIIYSEYEYGMVESAVLSRDTWNSLYGGLLFLGIILGVLFTIAFVLIIYFKQISEGYEDQGRFLILEKVGMDKGDIKKTIFKQIKLVFILPLATAFLHVLVANPILCKLLAMMNLTDKSLIALGTVGVCAVFAVFYFVVYLLTAKVYKKILGLAK